MPAAVEGQTRRGDDGRSDTCRLQGGVRLLDRADDALDKERNVVDRLVGVRAPARAGAPVKLVANRSEIERPRVDVRRGDANTIRSNPRLTLDSLFGGARYGPGRADDVAEEENGGGISLTQYQRLRPGPVFSSCSVRE